MDFSDEKALSSVWERHADFVVNELLETSPTFRAWFFNQVVPAQELEEFLGATLSVEDDTGEADILFGVKTMGGDRHLVLVENKIDAAKQDRQIERYFERGQYYVDREDWDAFTVALIAPRGYVGEEDRTGFNAIVQYEQIIDCVNTLGHDSGSFIVSVLKQAITKQSRSGVDNSATTRAVRNLFLERNDFSAIKVERVTKTKFEIVSTHPDHPDAVFYVVYVPGPHGGDKAIVRLEIAGDTSDQTQNVLMKFVKDTVGGLSRFEHQPGHIMDPARAVLWRQDYKSHDEYIQAISEALYELVCFYQPSLVGAEFKK